MRMEIIHLTPCAILFGSARLGKTKAKRDIIRVKLNKRKYGRLQPVIHRSRLVNYLLAKFSSLLKLNHHHSLRCLQAYRIVELKLSLLQFNYSLLRDHLLGIAHMLLT